MAMKNITVKQRDHIARLIRKEVEYFNGWRVDDNAVESACFKAACNVENYLKRKNRPRSPLDRMYPQRPNN